TSLRERNAKARSDIRSSDWAHLRQVRGRSPTGGIDAAQSVARGASGEQGPWMALARKDMASPLLRPRAAHTQLPTDNAVAARTRGAARAVRSHCLAPPAAIATLPGPSRPAGSAIDGRGVLQASSCASVGWAPLTKTSQLRAEQGSRCAVDPIFDGTAPRWTHNAGGQPATPTCPGSSSQREAGLAQVPFLTRPGIGSI